MKIKELYENKQLERLGDRFVDTIQSKSTHNAILLLDQYIKSKYAINIVWDEEAIEDSPSDYFISTFEPLCAFIERLLSQAKVQSFAQLTPIVTIMENRRNNIFTTPGINYEYFSHCVWEHRVHVLSEESVKTTLSYMKGYPAQKTKFKNELFKTKDPVCFSWSNGYALNITVFERKA